MARRFFKDKRGIAALEFALIAPILILLYLGSVEMTGGLDVDKQLGRATAMIADLVTQQKTTITKAKISDIMKIGEATLLPYRRDTPKITVTAFEVSSSGTATAKWSWHRENGVETRGSGATLDANLNIPGTSIIRVDMNIAYVPLLAWTIESTVRMSNGTSTIGLALADTEFGPVRQGAAPTCGNC